jgi:hypothetical protein
MSVIYRTTFEGHRRNHLENSILLYTPSTEGSYTNDSLMSTTQSTTLMHPCALMLSPNSLGWYTVIVKILKDESDQSQVLVVSYQSEFRH